MKQSNDKRKATRAIREALGWGVLFSSTMDPSLSYFSLPVFLLFPLYHGVQRILFCTDAPAGYQIASEIATGFQEKRASMNRW
jgi:hypothetical protein